MTTIESPATTSNRHARSERLAHEPLLPASPRPTFVRGTAQSIRGVWQYRQLLGLLFRRELKVRYKDSALGFFWTLLRPLAQLLVYAIAIGEFLRASKGVDEYPIYVFAGLTIWQLFSEIVNGGTGSILTNGGLIKKIYLPREVFPLSVVGSSVFNFAMQLCILVSATFVFGKPPVGENLGYAFMAFAIVLLYGSAFAFVLGAVNVYLRDVQYLVEICLMWGLWTAPIVYRWSQVSSTLAHHGHWLRDLYLTNPITQAVLGFQRAFWRSGSKPGGQADTIDDLHIWMLGSIGVGIALLWLAQRIFARLQCNFAQEL
jgi:ABC-2 type transport system permease protein